jgi:predicted RNA binding protein YcfA (HicA-like mRNA interferase family)
MGRLSDFKYREVARRLKAFGYAFDRPGPGSHEVWRRVDTGRKVTIPRHARPLAEGTLRAILREAGIDVEEFLNCR